MSALGNKENMVIPAVLVSTHTFDNVPEPAEWTFKSHPSPQAPSSQTPLRRPKKASWKLPADNKTLLECLKQQQAAGNQSDTGFKPVAWTACVVALRGSEKRSGGGPKVSNCTLVF